MQAPGAALLQIAGYNGCYRARQRNGEECLLQPVLSESNMVPFILVLVVKMFKTNTNTQLPPTLSLWRICQEIAFSPPAEEPSQESTAVLKWLGHAEHLAIPVLDWKSDSCSTS